MDDFDLEVQCEEIWVEQDNTIVEDPIGTWDDQHYCVWSDLAESFQ